jgi:DMSO/TMAO reductase YedYZ molybdopterin-dependent catalytic subunit
MRQPDAGMRRAAAPPAAPSVPRPAGPGDGASSPVVLPPGQHIPGKLPVLHYGRVPAFNPQAWSLRVCGATGGGREQCWSWAEVSALPRREVTADLHCVTRFTIPGNQWAGVAAAEILRRVPPADSVTHVMVWAEYGYSANVRIADFAADTTLLATHLGGVPLAPEHGYPMRLVVPTLYAWKSVKWIRAIEYLTRDRRGFWEERGYHNTADPWREQRYSHQEEAGEGPPL